MCHVRCVTHCDCVDVNVRECVWCVGVCERVRDGKFVSLGLLCLLRVRSVVPLCVLGPCRLLCVVLCSILQDIGSVVCHVCCDVCREFVSQSGLRAGGPSGSGLRKFDRARSRETTTWTPKK